jgi:molecular chaperone GrpE
MKLNKSKRTKDERRSDKDRVELTEFFELLDGLLPQKNELLRDTLQKNKKDLENTLVHKDDDSDYLLELEKAKNSCLQELLQIIVEQYQRVSADYANFQKRAPKQIADTIAYEKETIIKTLLPALDNFESALGGLRKAHSAKDGGTLVKGIQIIYDQMLDIMKSHGVEQIRATGEKFDPAVHQAMMQQAEPEQEADIVLEDLQTGYKLNGRVIRPSKVIVNKLPSEQSAIPEQEGEQKPQEQSIDMQEQVTDEGQTSNTE